MSRYMTHQEMSELSEIVQELRDSGEITDVREELSQIDATTQDGWEELQELRAREGWVD